MIAEATVLRNRDIFVDLIVQDTLCKFLGLDLEPVGPTDATLHISSVVRIFGPWSGAVVVQGATGVAEACAMAMFALSRDELSPQDVCDAWGEVANLLAGATIRDLPGGQDLGTPTVIQGSSYEILVSNTSRVARSAFQLDGEHLRVAIFETRREVP